LFVVDGQHDNLLAGIALQYATTGFDAADTGHADIHQDNVGIDLLSKSDAIFTAIGFADNSNLPAVFQQTPNAGSYQSMIVGEQYVYHGFNPVIRRAGRVGST
jgi:hypothetical protein